MTEVCVYLKDLLAAPPPTEFESATLQFCMIERSAFGTGECVGVTVMRRIERYFGVFAS